MIQQRVYHSKMKSYWELLAENNQLKERIAELEKPKTVLTECNIFDKETIYENCTVQIWENSVTGDISIGWWQN